MKLFISLIASLISEFCFIIISDFALSRFPRPRSLQTEEKMGGIEERWDDPSKPAEFLGSGEEWHHVSPNFVGFGDTGHATK